MLLEEFDTFDHSRVWSSEISDVIHAFEKRYLSGMSRSCLVATRSRIPSESAETYFGVMPVLSTSDGIFLTKLLRAKTPERREKRIDGLALAFSSTSGSPLAVFDGAALTDLKCAAIAGLLTKYCSASSATTLSIVGCGALARAQLRGVLAVRPIRSVLVTSRTRRGFEVLADICMESNTGIQVEHVSSVTDDLMRSEIICTATNSDTPLLRDAGMLPNVHINCMGSHSDESREVSQETLRRSVLIVEDRATAVSEIGESHRNAVDVEQVIKGDIPNLQSSATIFSSTGYAPLDLWAAAHVLSQEKMF